MGNAQYHPGPADVAGMNVDVRGRDAPAVPCGDRPRRGHNLRAILQHRGFRRLLAVRLSAQVADGLFQAGLAGSVLFNPEQATSPMAIAAGFAVLLLPYSLIGPYVGVLLDRWSRRTVIVLTSLLRAGLVVPAAVLIWYGKEGVPFLVTTLIIIGLGRLLLAAVSAATPHVVEDARLVSANAVGNTLGSFGYSLGLGSVALLIRFGLPPTFHGYAIVAALAPLGYLVSATIARRSFDATELGPDAQRHHHATLGEAMIVVGVRTAEGVRHLAARKRALYPLIAQSAHRICYGTLILAVLLRCRGSFAAHDDVGRSVAGLGGVFLAGGLGTVIGALVTPTIARHIGGWRWIVVMLGLTAASVAAFGTQDSATLLPIAIGWVSATSQGTKIVVDTALQHECYDDYRGRVFSVNDTLFNLCFVVGAYAGALLLPPSGRSTAAVLTVVAGYTVIALWFGLAYGRVAAVPEPSAAAPGVPQQKSHQGQLTAAGHEARWASAR